MKTIRILLSLFIPLLLFQFFSFPVSGQIANTTYFMESYSNRTSFNPALRPLQGYLGMPFLLNNLYADVKTNTLNLHHLTFPVNGELLSFMHKDVSAVDFLDNLSTNNYAALDFNYTLFSFGFYSGESFWNVDFNIRSSADANIPYSAFELVKKGFAMNEPSYYEVKDVKAKAQLYSELGVGYSKPFMRDNLTVGIKGKMLLGLADANIHIKDLLVNAGLDEWKVRSNVSVKGSAPGIRPVFEEDGDFDKFEWNEKFGISGFGLGLDLGATFSLRGVSHLADAAFSEFLKKLTFSMAFTDIGFIYWSKKNSTSLYSSMEEKVISGDFNIDFDNSSSLEDDLNNIKDTLEDMIDLQEEKPNSRSTVLRTNMNIGFDYRINKKFSTGILSTTCFNDPYTLTEWTVAGTYRPTGWFETAVSYSFIHSEFNTFGVALNFVPSKGLNLFLASDYIIPHVNSEFIPVKSKAVNFQMGLSIPLSPKRE